MNSLIAGAGNFDREVTDRIVSELVRRKIKQVELISMCKDVGMPISQPDISRIFSGKKTLSLYQCAAVCKALEMSVDFFLWGEDRHREDFCNPHDAEALRDIGRELKWYLGEYYFYCLSTAQGEDKILKGKLSVEEKKEFYNLRLVLNTGVKDLRGEWICKEYFGRILVSLSLGVAYLILKNETIGEICMVCIRHRNYNIQDMECRIGLVLTASAGESKEPAAHKALLVRERLSDEQVENLRPWLKLTDDNIRMESSFFQEVLEEAVQKYPAYANQLKRIKEYTLPKEIVDLSAEVLRRQLPMDRNEFVDFLTSLYEKAEVAKNYKISPLDDVRIYEKIVAMKELNRQSAGDG